MDIPDFFSLDIGNHSVKVAQIKRLSNTDVTLEAIGSAPAEFSLVESSSDDAIKGVAEQVKAARDAAGIKTKNCVASMPESPVFSRLLTIPKVTAEQLEETVHWELKPLIPVPLADVDIAFLEIGEKVINGQTMIDIYAVAAPKTLTDRYQKMATMAGINLLAVETESLANTRTVAFNMPSSGDMMVSDFGANGTDLVVARNGVPVYAQSISTGSDAFTKAIAADYGIDLNTAEKYKRAYGIDFSKGEGKIAKTIEPLMQILVNEMSRTLTYFKQRIGDTGATNLYMCGEAANMPGLGAYLTEKLGLQAQLINPLTKIKVSSSAQKVLQQLSPVGFTVAIGLGLKVN